MEESMIDLVFTNNGTFDSLNFQIEGSDHDFVWSRLHPFGKQRVTSKVAIRDYSGLTMSNLRNHTQGLLVMPSDLSDLINLQKELLNKISPIRVIRTRCPEQIVNPRIEKVKKRRDRFLKKYKRTGKDEYLRRCKEETKALKKIIRHETKQTFQRKAQSPNVKCFWNAVGSLQGKNTKPDLKLKINGELCEDSSVLAQHVADFFDQKIKNLTSGMSKIEKTDISSLGKMNDFSLSDIKSALEKVKSKLRSGVDSIPLKLTKLFGLTFPNAYLQIFNNIIKSGFPQEWKVARVVPVPKKGDNTDVKNFRPVSNLCSLSKVFERCVLARLIEHHSFDTLVGAHQHGFRRNHSTSTCLMVLKDLLATKLDEKKQCILYSLDLSAAFDMLRPDTFFLKFKNVLPDGVLRILIDFLSDRKFFVNVADSNSLIVDVERGCPQGSVLGPVLFSLYVGDVMRGLNNCEFVSYADDSYVVSHPLVCW